MATTIKLKNGSGAPLAGDLVAGEPALDLTNKRLYTEDSGGTVIEIGTNPSTIDINAGTIDGTVIGGSSAAAGTFTTFTSTGIDDNATANVVTIAGGSSGSNSVIQTLNSGSNSGFYGFSTDFGFEIGDGGVGGKTVRINNNGTAVFSHNQVQDVIDMSNASSVTVAGFTSTGIDDNATSTAITIDASEQVGIGETAPSRTLDIKGANPLNINTTSNNHIHFQVNDVTTGQYVSTSSLPHQLCDSTGTVPRLVVDSNGDLGVGTTNPLARLHTYVSAATVGETDPVARFERFTTGDNHFLDIAIDNDNNLVSFQSTGSSDGAFTFGGTATESMRIDASGRVGIGVTPFSAGGNGDDLMIGDPTTATGAGLTIGSTTTGDIQFGDATTGAGRYAGLLRYEHANDAMVFWTASAERMRIDSSGNLLVGQSTFSTTSPGTKITTGSTDAHIFVANTTTTAAAPCLYLNRQGGDGDIVHFRRQDVQVGSISVDAVLPTTNYNTTSDQRLKENIVDAPAGNIDDICVRSFDWKESGAHQNYGMIAQELVNVAPEAVTQGETDDDIWQVDYSKLVPMMIKEIQDLRARVAQLEGA